jgi:putative hydrolase of the HAD superfamily
MPKPPVLLFDIGGVLVENAGFAALSALLPGAPDEAALKERWLQSSAVRDFELGAITPAVFADRFRAEWGLALSREAFIAEFLGWPRGYFPGALELLARLRPRHHVSCLSNSNILHWAKFGGFAGLFETMHVSHLMGRIKPDPDMFAAAVASLGVAPADIVFFDDSPLNVRVGGDVGMRAFHVEGVADVERVLRHLDLA